MSLLVGSYRIVNFNQCLGAAQVHNLTKKTFFSNISFLVLYLVSCLTHPFRVSSHIHLRLQAFRIQVATWAQEGTPTRRPLNVAQWWLHFRALTFIIIVSWTDNKIVPSWIKLISFNAHQKSWNLNSVFPEFFDIITSYHAWGKRDMVFGPKPEDRKHKTIWPNL